MTKNNKPSRKKIIDKLAKISVDQYLRVSDQRYLRAFIQSLNIPGFQFGGVEVSLGQLLDGFIFAQAEKIKRKRLEESLKKLKDKLKKLEIDHRHIEQNIEQYSLMFLCCLLSSANEYRDRLREAYINMLANFFSTKYSKTQNKELYLNILFSLTPDHLLVLRVAFDYLGNTPQSIHKQAKTLKEHLKKTFTKKKLEEEIILALIKDLESKGLLNEAYSPTYGGGEYRLYLTGAGRKILELIE